MEKEIIRGRFYNPLILGGGVTGLGTLLFIIWAAVKPTWRSSAWTFFNYYVYLFIISLLFIAVGVILLIAFRKFEFVLTDKRVYGIARFGKRVDIPINQISSVSMSVLNTLSVASSSGMIAFSFMQNKYEVHKAISQIIMQKQDAQSYVTVKNNSQSEADELKKYKELLDSGTITPEEFEAKKKQILGL